MIEQVVIKEMVKFKILGMECNLVEKIFIMRF